MKGDFTRNTFDPKHNFSRVLMQQGRVQLDADFNEQTAILLHYLRTMMVDLIGPYGGPCEPGGNCKGFEITKNDSDFLIGKGRYYVDGILCENDRDTLKFNEQEGFNNMTPPQAGKNYYVYLDVWERHISHVQSDCIREKALGGPDTCARAKIIWQVNFDEVPAENNNINCEGAKEWVKKLPKLSNVTMKARVKPTKSDDNACSVPPESRYRGTENQLYRIEVHRGGSAWNGQVDKKDKPADVKKAATFKWSRDNGSIVFPIIRQKGNIVRLQSLGRDERTSLKVGDWVEIIDDGIELRGQLGTLAQVDKVDLTELTVKLKLPDDVSTDFSRHDYNENNTNHPLLRRWDQRVKEGIKMSEGAIVITESSKDWLEIEDGIEVQFQLNASTPKYRTGDYWLIPARVATGKIEWPITDSGNEEAILPHGIEHHYAPLAVISNGTPTDCRCSFKLDYQTTKAEAAT